MAFAYVVQVWAQRRVSATRIAIVFSLETVFAGLFGYLLAGDRLGALGFAGCAAIFAGIVVAEPAAAATLQTLGRTPRARARASTSRMNGVFSSAVDVAWVALGGEPPLERGVAFRSSASERSASLKVSCRSQCSDP